MLAAGSRVCEAGCRNKKRLHSCSLLEGGDYLLSRFRSTIGVARFNFSVRNGKRWSPCAVITLIRLKDAHDGSGEAVRNFQCGANSATMTHAVFSDCPGPRPGCISLFCFFLRNFSGN